MNWSKIVVFLLTLGLLAPFTKGVEAQEEGLRYLLINSGRFNLSSPRKAASDFKDIKKRFEGVEDSRIKVGVSSYFSCFEEDLSAIEQKLSTFLQAAEKSDLPVLIKLDTEQWWNNRPDLWNWWDPNRPGYNPENCRNVEWTGWGCEYAMKIAWRNWGRQIRVAPPPNLMSPDYRKAVHEAMDRLLPIVMNWQTSLPENKKNLFVGLMVGWETSIGYNAYYYPNGNDYFGKPEADDPKKGFTREDVLRRGLVQTGYAALTASGIRTSGDITEEDLVEVCRRHLEDMARYAHAYGFARDKVFTHGVGNEQGERLYDAAVNAYSCPAWSEYWYADNPLNDTGITRNIERMDAPCWGIAEWFLPVPQTDLPHWKKAFKRSLESPACRFVCVYNWESLSGPDSKVIEASRNAIQELTPAD
jgi:hypothetical protein